ncbi:MAG: hypothetical protein AAF718_08915 [Pseudomonadota bacterium]
MTGSKTIATPYLLAAFLVAALGYADLLIWLALCVTGQPPDHDGAVEGAQKRVTTTALRLSPGIPVA